MNSKIKTAAALVLGIAVMSLIATGCNTTKGFGRDVEKLGDKIEQKASR
ncbi:MAG: entericidin A/B family lipoprotein [Opitutaceae bacterium]|nr:entericidin A/B family lipoprotein [Opitutaceae bacterium]